MAAVHHDGNSTGAAPRGRAWTCLTTWSTGSQCPQKTLALKGRPSAGGCWEGVITHSVWLGRTPKGLGWRLGPYQADLLTERPSGHESFDLASGSIPWWVPAGRLAIRNGGRKQSWGLTGSVSPECAFEGMFCSLLPLFVACCCDGPSAPLYR